MTLTIYKDGTPIRKYVWVKTLNLLLALAFPLTHLHLCLFGGKHTRGHWIISLIKDSVVNVPKDVYFGV
jgi:hypothetical protein